MPQTIRERHTVKLNLRVPPNYLTFLDEYTQSQHLENRSQAAIRIFDEAMLHDLQPYGQVLNFQKCQYRSEIPAHYREFVNCRKDKVTITEEQCVACSLYEVLKVPLETVETLKMEKRELTTDINNLKAKRAEFDEGTERRLRQRIAALDRDLRLTQQVLRDERGSSEKSLATSGQQKEKEIVEHALGQSQLAWAPESKEFPANKAISIERTIKETVKEKQTTERLVFQGSFENAEIVCPLKQEYVPAQACMQSCAHFKDCPYSTDIAKKSVPKDALVRFGTHS